MIEVDALTSGPEPNEGGGYPRVLEDLKRVFLVVTGCQSAAEVLRCHESLWKWVRELTSAQEEHDLSIQFILRPDAGRSFEESLAIGLAVPTIDPESTGHAIARMSDGLAGVLGVAARTLPKDLVCLRARQKVDARCVALNHLRDAAGGASDFAAVRTAAGDVLALFECEFYLDLFCRPPTHPNGHKLRLLLRQIVTNSVTQNTQEALSKEILNLLIST